LARSKKPQAGSPECRAGKSQWFPIVEQNTPGPGFDVELRNRALYVGSRGRGMGERVV
jgi:hypothetical protein